MDRLSDRDYYLMRAQAARGMSARAVTPDVARIHQNMAERYEDAAARFAPREGARALFAVDGAGGRS